MAAAKPGAFMLSACGGAGEEGSSSRCSRAWCTHNSSSSRAGWHQQLSAHTNQLRRGTATTAEVVECAVAVSPLCAQSSTALHFTFSGAGTGATRLAPCTERHCSLGLPTSYAAGQCCYCCCTLLVHAGHAHSLSPQQPHHSTHPSPLPASCCVPQ